MGRVTLLKDYIRVSTRHQNRPGTAAELVLPLVAIKVIIQFLVATMPALLSFTLFIFVFLLGGVNSEPCMTCLFACSLAKQQLNVLPNLDVGNYSVMTDASQNMFYDICQSLYFRANNINDECNNLVYANAPVLAPLMFDPLQTWTPYAMCNKVTQC